MRLPPADATPTGTPAAGEHVVQFYEQDSYLVELLGRFVAGGLAAGEAVLLILSADHERALAAHLTERGLDLSHARTTGRYIVRDVDTMLAEIGDGGGGIDPARFRAVFGAIVSEAHRRSGGVRVFGEMVMGLWRRGVRAAALELEGLWDALARSTPHALLCAYPMSAFPTAADRADLEAVCRHHSRVLPTESYLAITEPAARLRAIAELQQRAQALETERLDRAAAERKLRERDERFRAVVAASPTPIAIVDPDGTVRAWNTAAERLFGWQASEIIGTVLPILGPDQVAQAAELRRAATTTGDLQRIETTRRHRDGSALPVAVTAGRLGSAPSPHGSVVLMYQDLRDAPADDSARGRLAAIVESSDDAIVGKTLDGIVTSWNRGAEQLFGYRAAEMVGQSIMRIVPPDRADDVAAILDTIARGERVEHYETERVHKDGRRINISLSVSPILDSRGGIIGASKIARDVTERRRAERERQAALRELSTLYAIGQAVSAERNFDRLLQFITDAATDLAGARFGVFLYNAADPEDGHPPFTLSGAPREWFEQFGVLLDSATFAPTFAATGIVRLDDVRTDSRHTNVQPHRDIAQSRLPIASYLAVPVVGRGSAVLGGLFLGHPDPGVFSEASERVVGALAAQFAIAIDNVRLYDAEQRARLAAEQASRAKDQFLAMLGHELRNPLSAVQNAVIAAGLDPARRDRALAIARHGTEQLTRLVDDLLDVARITQGRITLQRERLSLRDVVNRGVEQVRAAFQDQALQITVTLPGHDVVVDGDPARLEQVVGNLLANAAKYSDPGGRILVSLAKEGADAVLTVRDHGIGIAADVLPRIFELFVQAEQPLDRTRGGLGIGLTLVNELVALHGGSVQAESAGLGKGAEFTVRLPAARSATPAPIADAVTPIAQRHAERRVLIVEDNADAAESLALLLELLGLRVRTVGNGAAALEAAAANPPDVMLIDIGLPSMDGYELARRIRADEALRHITLVALTGYGQEEDRQRSFAAGFDYHLVKPVDVDQFRSLVAEIPSAKRAVH